MIIGIDASRALRARRTGTERYSLEITRHLLHLPEAAEHTWRLYADCAPPADLLPEQTPGATSRNVCWRVLPGRRLWTHRALGGEVTRDRPDVLFVPAHVLPLVMPPSRLPPSVVTVHDLGYHLFPDSHTRSQRLYLHAGTRWSVAAARAVIAVSQSTAADLRRFYGVPAERITVVYEAAPDAVLVSAGAMAAVQERYALHRPYALFVGTIQPRKNIARLVQAYAWLYQNSAIGWDFVLAGAPGWLSDSLLEEARSLGLADQLRFLGYVPDDDLPALLKGARFFCFPTLFEGFGLPVLEAQRYGVPVLTSNNSSLPEVAGDAALLVDPADTGAIAAGLARLASEEPLRADLRSRGLARAARFTWDCCAEQTLRVLAGE